MKKKMISREHPDASYLARLVDLGILSPVDPDRFGAGDVRRVLMARSLEDAGIPIDGVADALRRGGIPLELLMVIREAIGMAEPSPDDRLREDEMAIVPFLEVQLAEGFRPAAIERLLRVEGDATRRITEQEAAWWNSEVIEPAMAAGKGPDEITNIDLSERISPLAERTMLAMYHAQQTRAWTANIIEGFETLMEKAGIHGRLARLPAICFLDISGYTRLTQELGDEAAADLAATVARLVRRSSVQYGGKPIKWLGDGVMFHFPDPGPGVRAALEMVDALGAEGLPPAHVGLAAGPVLFQEGDYFGQTVNLSARIADYARQGEVLVSRAVADASQGEGVAFAEIGDVELKGVSGTVNLLRASFA